MSRRLGPGHHVYIYIPRLAQMVNLMHNVSDMHVVNKVGGNKDFGERYIVALLQLHICLLKMELLVDFVYVTT
jgi:hypothetical protein